MSVIVRWHAANGIPNYTYRAHNHISISVSIQFAGLLFSCCSLLAIMHLVTPNCSCIWGYIYAALGGDQLRRKQDNPVSQKIHKHLFKFNVSIHASQIRNVQNESSITMCDICFDRMKMIRQCPARILDLPFQLCHILRPLINHGEVLYQKQASRAGTSYYSCHI